MPVIIPPRHHRQASCKPRIASMSTHDPDDMDGIGVDAYTRVRSTRIRSLVGQATWRYGICTALKMTRIRCRDDWRSKHVPYPQRGVDGAAELGDGAGLG